MTQAVNLANFANNLDTSGGLNPAALNAATPISKGGTAATTASAARTSLGVDYATIGALLYPVGSIYINASVATNPATLLGFGTWIAFGAGRVPVGNGSGFTAGATGGSADAIVVSHSHTISDPGHSHDVPYSLSSTGLPAGTQVASQPGGATSAALTGITGTNTTGTTATNANLQPYIVVYMWTRTV